MNGRFGVWVLALSMCVATATAAALAFVQSPDRSAFALTQWGIIGMALAAPLFHVPGLMSVERPTAVQARNRCTRIVILAYLPLASALYLLAFSSR